MMNKLRLAANKPILKIISIIIILSFLLTGTAGYMVIGSKDYVAKVNNVIITREQFKQAIQQEKDLFKEEGLENELLKIFSSEKNKKMFYQQILDRLIGIILLNEYSKKIGFSVSQSEVEKEIYKSSFFHTKGVFDQKKYQSFLKQNNIKIRDFLENVQKNLINRQIIKAYISDEFILPEEFNFYIRFLLEQRKIKIFTLLFSDFYSKQVVHYQELLKYYNLNKERFFSPETVQLNYIKFNLNLFNKKIFFSEEELQNFYIQNKEKFKQKEKRHYSVIQLDTQKSANLIFKSLKSGANFKDLAIRNSTDKFSAMNYGSIGWFDFDSIPYEIKYANLNKIGQFSNIIKSGKRYLIFCLDKIQPETIKSFKSVKSKIIKKLKYQKAFTDLQMLKQNLNLAIKNKISFAEIEKIVGRKILTTDFFHRNNIPKDINFTPIIDEIFKENSVKNEIKNNNDLKIINLDHENFIVFQIKQYKPKILQSFVQAKKSLIHIIKFEKTSDKITKKANQILFDLKKNKNNLKFKNVKFSKPLFVNRFWNNADLTEQIFNMPEPKKNDPIYFIIKDSKNNLIIVQFLEVIHKKMYSYQIQPFFKNYKIIFSNIIFELFMNCLHSQAKIEFGKIF